MLATINSTAKPFVKWAGGKGQLLPQITPLFPAEFENYFEPFIGGGAVFFNLKVNGTSHINDINQTLVSAYKLLKNDLNTVVKELKIIESEFLARSSEDRKVFYYAKRAEYNSVDTGLLKTINLIFLNRTCFNGLYRENRRGEFNVPMGNYLNPRICDEINLHAISKHLEHTVITSHSYMKAVNEAKAGDFVYFDPPYFPLNETSSFTSYNKDDFGPQDQESLRDLYVELDKRGCYLVLSNSSADYIQQLYKDFRQETVYAGRNINAKGASRGKVPELIVLNY